MAEEMFLIYEKSDKQYYVLPQEGNELRLVINPEFYKQEKGYLDPSGKLFGQDPAPELLKYITIITISRGLITSSMPMGGGPSQETAPINAPMMNEDKHQPVMPALAPAEAPTQPIEKETESI